MTSTAERLSAADSSGLEMEREGQAYSIGVAGILAVDMITAGGVDPDLSRLRAVLAPRVARVRRLNQRVEDRGRRGFVWVDAPADVSVHVRAGERVTDRAGVADLCGRLLTEPLPRDRPLWDLVVAPGPGAGRTTLVLRLHHAIADGVSAVQIFGALVDPPAEPLPAARDHRVHGTSRRLLARVLATVPAAVGELATIIRAGRPSTSLVGPLGRERGIGLVEVDLTAVHDAAHDHGATVNDALLAAVAEATGALLASRGDHASQATVSVPVSLRPGADADTSAATGPAAVTSPHERRASGNRVGVMLVPLPLDEPDPARRLRLVATRTRRAKHRARVLGPFVLTRTRWGTRLLARWSRRQRVVSLFVTNVPGPRQPVRLAGAPLLHAWPLSVVAGNVRIAVAALSYSGRLGVTVAFDAHSTPDAGVFVSALRHALDRMCGVDAGARRDGVASPPRAAAALGDGPH